ncbi:MAG: phosphoribosylglycinamide formyltransferase [Balneolaceae bacterium]
MKKLVIFASGSGSNFQAIIDAIARNELEAQIAGLITNRDETGAAGRAISNNIPVTVIKDSDPVMLNEKLEAQLSAWNPDLIILAGFLNKIPDKIVRKYHGRIINIHPSLLPKYGGKGFYGRKVHQAVLNSDDKITGCTVHYVNDEYDKGDIIEQSHVEIHPTDTAEKLAARVLKAEHQLLPRVIKKLLT